MDSGAIRSGHSALVPAADTRTTAGTTPSAALAVPPPNAVRPLDMSDPPRRADEERDRRGRSRSAGHAKDADETPPDEASFPHVDRLV